MYIRFSSTSVPVRPRSPAQPIGSPSMEATTNVPPGAANCSAATGVSSGPPYRSVISCWISRISGAVRWSP